MVIINQSPSNQISKIRNVSQSLSVFLDPRCELPVILNVLQQLLELSGLDREEGQHASEEEQEGIDPPLERDEEVG